MIDTPLDLRQPKESFGQNCPQMGGLNLQVCDNGIGIEPVHLDNIFNRFCQVPTASRQQGGRGIVLAFDRNILELHNGTISVSSAPVRERYSPSACQ